MSHTLEKKSRLKPFLHGAISTAFPQDRGEQMCADGDTSLNRKLTKSSSSKSSCEVLASKESVFKHPCDSREHHVCPHRSMENEQSWKQKRRSLQC